MHKFTMHFLNFQCLLLSIHQILMLWQCLMNCSLQILMMPLYATFKVAFTSTQVNADTGGERDVVWQMLKSLLDDLLMYNCQGNLKYIFNSFVVSSKKMTSYEKVTAFLIILICSPLYFVLVYYRMHARRIHKY